MLEVDIAGKRGDFDYAVSFKSDARVTALFGVSGAGKSTVVDALSGHEQPENGRMSVDDTVFFDAASRKNMAVRKRRVGHIFQDARLFPHMSVKRNLTYARWAGWRSRKSAGFDDVVRLLDLGDLLSRYPRQLSGGEKQRVAIGRALLSDPRLLLMDEPLTGLDLARKREIMPYLERLAYDEGVPIVYVSHDLEEVVRLAEHVVLIGGGRVQTHGPLVDVLPRIHGQFETGARAPASLLEATFADVDPAYLLTRLKVGGQMITVPKRLDDRATPYRVRINATDVAIALERPRQTSFQNILNAKVISVFDVDAIFADATLSVDGQLLTARMTRKATDDLVLDVDMEVFALIKSVAVEGVL